MADSQPAYLRIGRITKPRGIKGEVKMAIYTDVPQVLLECDVLYLGRGERDVQSVGLQNVRFHKGAALLMLEGTADRNEAELLRGMDVFVPEEWMPALQDDEFYVHQILGLRVVTTDGEDLGTVEDVIFTGANEVYVVRGGVHGEVLLPAISDVVKTVDLDAGEISVELMDGLI